MVKFFLSIVFCLMANLLIAQPGGGDPNGGGKPVPIGGLEILLIAGGALGVGKLISNKSKK